MKIKELFDSPEKWTQGTYARTAEERSVLPDDKLATCWCITGALLRCYPRHDERRLAILKLQLAVAGSSNNSIIDWNDFPGRSFKEVRALLEEADV